MSKYHFEFSRPDGAVLFDEQGKELPDLETAKAHARLAIQTVLKDAAPAVDWSRWSAMIKNAEGEELSTIPFRDVMMARRSSDAEDWP